ncbi:uncharacterized protein LOC123682767 [Harmonia axyridis]|uniref:uncharacterized protein LOC123682767 n=1 Tax=Harmonia axyridis TaxID=115357 RepID=UPI001E277E8B|nr:uncharacterized protein LOC123682767 [Harmonia axyridis]
MQNRNNISLNRGVNMLSANNTRTAISNVGNGMRPSRRTRYASCSRLDLPMQNRTNISLNRSVNLVANKTRRTIDTNGMRLQYASGSENQRRLLQRLAVLNQRITEAEEYMRMLRRSASYLSHQVQVSLHRQNLVDIDYNRKGSNARLEVIIEVPSDEYSSVPPIKDLKACETNRERLAIRRSKQARRRLVFNTISMILVVFLPLMGIGFILYSYLNGLDPPIFTRNMVG